MEQPLWPVLQAAGTHWGPRGSAEALRSPLPSFAFVGPTAEAAWAGWGRPELCLSVPGDTDVRAVRERDPPWHTVHLEIHLLSRHRSSARREGHPGSSLKQACKFSVTPPNPGAAIADSPDQQHGPSHCYWLPPILSWALSMCLFLAYCCHFDAFNTIGKIP